MRTFAKLRPIDTITDARYQRDVDEQRARAMSQRFDPSLFGVPVLSRRITGDHVRIDGQHRIEAAIMADRGHEPVLCEIHEGLSLREEAELFLRLNRERTAVRIFDKYKARLVAHEPVAMSIDGILKSLKLKVGKSQQTRTVCAIEALESGHSSGKLAMTCRILTEWADREASVYEGPLIRAVAAFLVEYPNVSASDLLSRLHNYTPDKVLSRLRATRGKFDCQLSDAGCITFREIYNERRPKRLQLPPMRYRGETAAAY